MNIQIAQSWSELNSWQLGKVARLLHLTTPETFEKDMLKIAFVIFQKKASFLSRLRLWKIITRVNSEILIENTAFVLENPDLYSFPNIDGLIKPDDRLGDISIKQFSIIDTLFYQWDQRKDELSLRLFVASLYRLNPEFERKHLPQVGAITDKISEDQRHAIAMIYKSVRLYITNRYPVIFPKPKKDQEELEPDFSTKKSKYTPFSKVINSMALDELKPLGTLHECNATLIYDFMDILTELIIHQRNKAKA